MTYPAKAFYLYRPSCTLTVDIQQIIGVMNILVSHHYALSLISTGKDIFAPIFISAAGSCVLV